MDRKKYKKLSPTLFQTLYCNPAWKWRLICVKEWIGHSRVRNRRRRRICGYFFLSLLFFTLKSSWKSHQMTFFFVKKEILGEKNHHLGEIWKCFHSNNDVFTLKSWRLESKRTRAKGKETTQYCSQYNI